MQARLHVDASAALGIAQRRGVGKVRHLDTGTLWVQEQDLKDKVKMVKVKGDQNPADAFTKYLPHDSVLKNLVYMNIGYRAGRAESSAQLYKMARMCQEEARSTMKYARFIGNVVMQNVGSGDAYKQLFW